VSLYLFFCICASVSVRPCVRACGMCVCVRVSVRVREGVCEREGDIERQRQSERTCVRVLETQIYRPVNGHVKTPLHNGTHCNNTHDDRM